MEQTESIEHGIDLVNDIAEGDELTAATWDLEVRQGVDPDPGSHLIGSPNLSIPNGTGKVTATHQRIAGILPDVLYRVRVTVQTTRGNTVSVWTHLPGEPFE